MVKVWGVGIKNDYYSRVADWWCINEEGQVWDLSLSYVGIWNVTPSGYRRGEKELAFCTALPQTWLTYFCEQSIQASCSQKGSGKTSTVASGKTRKVIWGATGQSENKWVVKKFSHYDFERAWSHCCEWKGDISTQVLSWDSRQL